MSFQHIDVEHDGPLTIITISRPEVHNALNYEAHLELETAFDAYANDETQWVAIITGAGSRAFCAGHDLKQQAEGGGLASPTSGFGGLTARYDLTKPVIAAVNGAAMGGGFELALAADLIVATSSASFALPEVRVGIAALGGGLWRLPREIGLKRAMGLLLTGRRISAQEGFDLGFVNEVVGGNPLVAAKRLAEQILECSPMSVRATKQAVMTNLDMPVADAMIAQWNYPAMEAMLRSEDHVEGPLAFVEKRSPRWSGR